MILAIQIVWLAGLSLDSLLLRNDLPALAVRNQCSISALELKPVALPVRTTLDGDVTPLDKEILEFIDDGEGIESLSIIVWISEVASRGKHALRQP